MKGLVNKIALLSLLLLAACAAGRPAPIVYGGDTAPHRAPQRASAPAPAPDWAAAEGTPLSAYALRAEDAQPFDPANVPRTHRVGADESLYDIAARYQIPLRALIEANGLDPLVSPAPGRELRLPPPRAHVVVAGESFEAIAERYNIDARSLALFNRLTLPHDLRAGERIYLPLIPPPRAGEVVASEARNRRGEAPSAALRAPAPPRAGEQNFAWPLRGEIVARFGAQSGGGRLDGIEIAGREGARVSAAADGVVVYAGDDLAAYGTLVLVRHAGDYVTAYGYGRRALVEEGQRARAGQALIELGSRPNGARSGAPRLLFQVRRGREPVDPLPLLGRP